MIQIQLCIYVILNRIWQKHKKNMYDSLFISVNSIQKVASLTVSHKDNILSRKSKYISALRFAWTHHSLRKDLRKIFDKGQYRRPPYSTLLLKHGFDATFII